MNDLDFDYVVVGAGSAGCVVAARLLERTDARVLVIEAGAGRADAPTITNPSRWVENLGTEYDWQYRYEPSLNTAGRAIPLARGKVVGGSGSINVMAWVRGNRHDFDSWAAQGNEAWDSIPCCRCSSRPRTGRTARAPIAAPAARSMSSGSGTCTPRRRR